MPPRPKTGERRELNTNSPIIFSEPFFGEPFFGEPLFGDCC